MNELWNLARAVSIVVIWMSLGYTWDRVDGGMKALGLTGAVAVTASQVLIRE